MRIIWMAKCAYDLLCEIHSTQSTCINRSLEEYSIVGVHQINRYAYFSSVFLYTIFDIHIRYIHFIIAYLSKIDLFLFHIYCLICSQVYTQSNHTKNNAEELYR